MTNLNHKLALPSRVRVEPRWLCVAARLTAGRSRLRKATSGHWIEGKRVETACVRHLKLKKQREKEASQANQAAPSSQAWGLRILNHGNAMAYHGNTSSCRPGIRKEEKKFSVDALGCLRFWHSQECFHPLLPKIRCMIEAISSHVEY